MTTKQTIRCLSVSERMNTDRDRYGIIGREFENEFTAGSFFRLVERSYSTDDFDVALVSRRHFSLYHREHERRITVKKNKTQNGPKHTHTNSSIFLLLLLLLLNDSAPYCTNCSTTVCSRQLLSVASVERRARL